MRGFVVSSKSRGRGGVPKFRAHTHLRAKRLVLLALKNAALAIALLATAGLAAVLTMRAMLAGQEVDVPGVVGLALDDAEATLESSGLAARVEGARHDPHVPVGRVLDQDPDGGERLKASRRVRLWLSQGPLRVTIPDVGGQPVRDARLALSDAGLPVARVVAMDSVEPEGTVLSQHPPPGDVDEGAARLSLLVSRGPGQTRFLMPDLIGRDAEQVTRRLQRAGWNLSSVRERSYPGLAAGIILRQAPSAGYPVTPATPIELEVSQLSP